MTKILIDADACPVKDEAIKVAVRHSLPIIFVSNSWMRLDDHPLIERVIVAEGPDEADNRIIEMMQEGDIIVTSDIPLASRALERAGHVLGPTGKPFNDDNIGMALAMRELKQELRETGEIKGHNPGFTKGDRSAFLEALENIIQKIKRGG